MENLTILNKPYHLDEEQVEFYQKNNYIKLKDVLDKASITHFNNVITKKVRELVELQGQKPLNERDTYGKAFLQLFNLWLKDEQISELIYSKRLAGIARDLMMVDSVRLYHDQALFKESGGGITPWHADQYYWPLSNDNTMTAWIPLQETPLDMGPLEFSAGSQAIQEGRELMIGDESEMVLEKKLRVTDFKHVIEAFDLGEVSFHSGWVFHRAGANQSGKERRVMTIIYMDSQMRLKNPENENQKDDWEKWCPGAEIGEIISTNLNPVLI